MNSLKDVLEPIVSKLKEIAFDEAMTSLWQDYNWEGMSKTDFIDFGAEYMHKTDKLPTLIVMQCIYEDYLNNYEPETAQSYGD